MTRATAPALALLVAMLSLAVIASSASAATGNLTYDGGPVLHSSAPYLVFWTPSGERIPASSRALMERYFADGAADSGKSSNVFGVLRQYYDRTGFADYRQTFIPARQVIVDTQRYPRRDTGACPDVGSAYPTCIADYQIPAELQRLITVDHLPTGGSFNAASPGGSALPRLSPNAPIYFVILPADVNLCRFLGTQCADKSIGSCGYHSNFADTGNDVILYALILTQCRATLRGVGWPKIYQIDNNAVTQQPNGNAADVLITPLSHEFSETITDPIYPTGWSTVKGNYETGDLCFSFGPFNPMKDTDPNAYQPTLGGNATAGTLFDQLINGHPYYAQSEWSNGDNNCEMRPSPGRIVPRLTVPREPNKVGAALAFNPAASASTNAISSATWNFGDGSHTAFFSDRAALTTPKHRYRKAGQYTVTLTLVDNRGNLRSTTHRVTVHPR